MSDLSTLIANTPKPWLDARVNSLACDKDLTVAGDIDLTGDLNITGGLVVSKKARINFNKTNPAIITGDCDDLVVEGENLTSDSGMQVLADDSQCSLYCFADNVSGAVAGFKYCHALNVNANKLITDIQGNSVHVMTSLSDQLNGTSIIRAEDANAVAEQLQIIGAIDVTKKLKLGYNTVSNYGSIQSEQTGAPDRLGLNPAGATVSIGFAIPSLNAYSLDVNGSERCHVLQSVADDTTALPGQLLIEGLVDSTQHLSLGYKTDSDVSYIDSRKAAVGKDLVLNPSGGKVIVADDLEIVGDLFVPTVGGTPSSLNYFEEYVHSSTFSGPWAGPSPALNVRITRLDNMVFVAISDIYTAAGAVALQATMDTVLPARFRMGASNMFTYCNVADNGSTVAGVVYCDAAGNIQFGVTSFGAPFAGMAGATGWASRVSFSYSIL